MSTFQRKLEQKQKEDKAIQAKKGVDNSLSPNETEDSLKEKGSRWVKMILDRGKKERSVIPFPRYDQYGEKICDVVLETLSVEQETSALADAALYAERMLNKTIQNESKLPDEIKHWVREDIKENSICVEILFRACKDPDDCTLPFFASPAEVRSFDKEEMGILMNAYHHLTQRTYKAIPPETSEQIELFIFALTKGLEDSDFFSQFSRVTLIRSLISLTKYCVEKDPDTFGSITFSS